jgi:hypothetical protein
VEEPLDQALAVVIIVAVVEVAAVLLGPLGHKK